MRRIGFFELVRNHHLNERFLPLLSTVGDICAGLNDPQLKVQKSIQARVVPVEGGNQSEQLPFIFYPLEGRNDAR